MNLDADLLDEEKMIRDSARSHAQEKLVPRVLKAFQNEEADLEIF